MVGRAHKIKKGDRWHKEILQVSKLLVKLKFAFKIRNQIQYLQKIKSVDAWKAVPEYRGRSQIY